MISELGCASLRTGTKLFRLISYSESAISRVVVDRLLARARKRKQVRINRSLRAPSLQALSLSLSFFSMTRFARGKAAHPTNLIRISPLLLGDQSSYSNTTWFTCFRCAPRGACASSKITRTTFRL